MTFDPDSAKFPVDLFGEERELALTLTLRSLASQSWVDPYFKLSWCTDLKSDNLQYNTLGRWVDGTNDSSTKRLMFQALFFFHNFL